MSKAKFKALAMMLPFLLADNDGFYHSQPYEPTEEDLEYLRKLKAEKEIERKIKSGLKPFDFNGQIIWALNEKNALRKYNNSLNLGS